MLSKIEITIETREKDFDRHFGMEICGNQVMTPKLAGLVVGNQFVDAANGICFRKPSRHNRHGGPFLGIEGQA